VGAQTKLFLALWPTEAARNAFAKWRDSWTWPSGATPVRTDLMHLTLHFIGPIDDEQVAPLADALAMPFSPFELQFGRPALWPNGVAVLEPDSLPQRLVRLHDGLAEALAAAGLPQEIRDYRPHVTMARRATGAMFPAGGPPINWLVGSYALMSSTPGPDGGYTVVRRYF
jgi:2'-5' RNA ligase